MNASRRRQRQPDYSASAMKMLCWALFLGLATSYSIQMTYKPPVKSSVSKLRNSRFSSSNSKQQAALSYVGSPRDIEGPSFEERMRGMVFGGGAAIKEKRHQEEQRQKGVRKLPPNVVTVETLQEYKKVVGEETNKVVAVRFYAPWCKACKAVAPLYYHMANKFPNVIFVDVPVTDRNSNLHQGLGVPSLPFGHIYHPTGGLVEELRLTRKHASSFARKLQTYVTGSCDLKAVGDASNPHSNEDGSEDET